MTPSVGAGRGSLGARLMMSAQKHNVFAQKHNRPLVKGLGQVTKVVLNELGLGARLLASVLSA